MKLSSHMWIDVYKQMKRHNDDMVWKGIERNKKKKERKKEKRKERKRKRKKKEQGKKKKNKKKEQEKEKKSKKKWKSNFPHIRGWTCTNKWKGTTKRKEKKK